jgi:hypothetical protein
VADEVYLSGAGHIRLFPMFEKGHFVEEYVCLLGRSSLQARETGCISFEGIFVGVC